jgi:hypothetical protein
MAGLLLLVFIALIIGTAVAANSCARVQPGSLPG